MAPSKPTNPLAPSYQRKIPQRFKSMRSEILAGMASKGQARQTKSRPDSISVEKAGVILIAQVKVVQSPPAQDMAVELSSKEDPPMKTPSIEAPSAKAPRTRSRPSATQLARVPKLPKRSSQLRAAFHAAAKAKNAFDRASLNGEAIESEGVAKRLPDLPPCLVDGVTEGTATTSNTETDSDPIVTQGQLESDVGLSKNADDCENGGDGQLLREDTGQYRSQKHPKHKPSFKVSKPIAKRRKVHQRRSPDELELTTEKINQATLDEEDSSDEELSLVLHAPSRFKKITHKPVNLRNIDITEFRMPKLGDSNPRTSLKSCSDGFVGKEASPIGLVMRVRYPGQKKPRDRRKKSPSKIGELVIGTNRHQEEKKRRKRARKIHSSSGQQYFKSHNDVVGLEDDTIITTSAMTTDSEHDGIDAPGMREEMLTDSDDHDLQMIENAELDNGDYNDDVCQLPTPSATDNTFEYLNSLPTNELDASQRSSLIQKENAVVGGVENKAFAQNQPAVEEEWLLGDNEEVSKQDLSDIAESDQTGKPAPQTPCLEEVTDNFSGELDITEDEVSKETESTGDEVGRGGDESDEAMESAEGENICILSDTHTERTDTESESDSEYHTSDVSSVHSNAARSEKSDDLQGEDGAVSESSQSVLEDEEIDLNALPVERLQSEDSEMSFEEPDLSDVASVEIRPSQDSEMICEKLYQHGDHIMTDPKSSNYFKSEEVDLDILESVERPPSGKFEIDFEEADEHDDYGIADAVSDTEDEVEASRDDLLVVDEELALHLMENDTQSSPAADYNRDFENVAHEEQFDDKMAASLLGTLEQNEPTVAIAGDTRALPLEITSSDEVMLLTEEQDDIEEDPASMRNPRIESLPSEIPDSYSQSQLSEMFSVSSGRNVASEALLQTPPEAERETLHQQFCASEQVWAPRVPRSSTPMEIEDDKIVDSYSPSPSQSVNRSGISKHINREHLQESRTRFSGSSRGSRTMSNHPRQSSRRKNSTARTHSLVLVRSRPSPEPAFESLMLSDQADSRIDSQIPKPQPNGLSTSRSDITTLSRMSVRSVRASTNPTSTSQQIKDEEILAEQQESSSKELPNTDVSSSQLTFVPEESYMSRAQQYLHSPLRRVAKTRSKSMFVSSSSSRLKSQRSVLDSQAPFVPLSSAASSVATRQLSKRLPTPRESIEEKGTLKELTRRVSLAHGTAPNSGRRRYSAIARPRLFLDVKFHNPHTPGGSSEG